MIRLYVLLTVNGVIDIVKICLEMLLLVLVMLRMRIARAARGIENVPESVHWCLLLIKFVCCDGRCRLCSVAYFRSRVSRVGKG